MTNKLGGVVNLEYIHGSKLGADGKDFRKCPKHNVWKKKGECSVCYVEQQQQLKQQELVTGSNKPKVKVGKV